MTKTETTLQRKTRRKTDKTSTQMLRTVHLVEHAEGRWLSLANPLPDGERGKTTAYLARTAAHLRFVRTLYQDDVLTAAQAGLMDRAARNVATLAGERLDALGYPEDPTPDNPTPHASVGG